VNPKTVRVCVLCSLSGRGRGRKRARTESTTTPTETPPKLHMSARNSVVEDSVGRSISLGMN